MKRLFVGLMVFCSCNVFAAEFGVGVSAKSNDASIYLPVNFGESFRLEGELRYFKRETENNSNSKTESKQLGVGAFYTKALNDDLTLLAGLRASYMESSNKSTSVTSISNLFSGPNTVTTTRSSEADGYEIAPVVGLEYLLAPNVSISAEIRWFDREQDGESEAVTESSTVNPYNLQDYSIEESGTDTRLILRFFF